jgi:multicomponent Na+:H+ antiporter subunit F
MVRAIMGATTFDRVVSIDALTALAVAVLALLALFFDKGVLLDIALVYALVAFLGDLAVAKYLEGRGLEE